MRRAGRAAASFLLAWASFPLLADSASPSSDLEAVSRARAAELDTAFKRLIVQHHVNTVGVAVIKGGKVDWLAVYGQQSEGVPASADTLFKVASITKTVTAETVLRLVAAGRLSLDESMSAHWVDPDLKDDPRHATLTPRMALTHTTGFANWRFFDEGGKLRFLSEPGTAYEYSGEGMKYLATFVEKKLGTPFEKLAQTYVFEPAGIHDAFMSVRKSHFGRIARPLDEHGAFPGYYCFPPGDYCREEGSFSATGDMAISVGDYAKFLISSMHGEGLNEALMKERDRVQVTAFEIDCTLSPEARCPIRVGYGLGWNVTELSDDALIGHAGTDWSTVSLAYYYRNSQDGLILFFNAPNKAGIAGMVDALGLLDPDSPKLHEYKARLARATRQAGGGGS